MTMGDTINKAVGGITFEESVKALQDVFVDHELGYEYKGCQNCQHQIDVLRACEWLEHGGDGQLHLTCPRWERRTDETN